MEGLITRKKFEIIRLDPPYDPQEKSLADFVTIPDLASNFESADSCGHQLYLTNEAMSHIRSHIGWGTATQHNCIEQGGILLGQAFRDRERGITYGVVNAAIAALSARGSSVHLEMSHDTWKEMLDSADKLLEESPQKELHVIGWYHTHPNGLQVFMSGTDRETQKLAFAHDWQFAMVLNPQKSRWRAFFGAEAEECKGFVIAEDEIQSITVSQSVPTEEIRPPITDETVTEPVPSSVDESTGLPTGRRRRGKLSRVRRLCVMLLFTVVVLQLLTIGLLFAPTLLRAILR